MRNKVLRLYHSLAKPGAHNGSGFKRICILFTVLLTALTGCGRMPEESFGSGTDEKKLQIVTTIFPPYDFARQIGGEAVEVTMLLKPGMESHSYEPTPVDIMTIMNSDIFIYAGGESDVWVEELLEGNDRKVESYALLDWVDPLEEETAEGMQVKGHDHAHDAHDPDDDDHTALENTDDDDHTIFGDQGSGDHTAFEAPGDENHAVHAVHLDESEYDEHVWTSPKNAMVITEKLCSVMSKKDPVHAAAFAENAAAYRNKLEELDSAFLAVVEQAERRTLIFGDRFPLLYFVKTYGLDYYAAFPGCSMETEPSAATIAFLTDKVKQEQIPVIFYLEMSNGKIAEAIAETTGAKTLVFYSGHSITAKDLEAGEDYLSLMYRNVEALQTALGKR